MVDVSRVNPGRFEIFQLFRFRPNEARDGIDLLPFTYPARRWLPCGFQQVGQRDLKTSMMSEMGYFPDEQQAASQSIL